MSKYNFIKKIRSLSDAALIDIALRLAADDPKLFQAYVEGNDTVVLIHGTEYTLNSSVVDKLIEAGGGTTDGSRKVTTIKIARELLGIGLKEAKDLVEELGKYGVLDRTYGKHYTYDGHHNIVKLVRSPGVTLID